MEDIAMSVLKKALKEAEEAEKNKLIELKAAEQQKTRVSDEYVDSKKRVFSLSETIHKIKKNGL